MNQIYKNDHILLELQAAHKQALRHLEKLKHEVKIKIGLAEGKEVTIEKTELIPSLKLLEYFLALVRSAQEAIDVGNAISMVNRESTFFKMRNLIMVLKEIRLELVYYKLGLLDIRKIYDEELPRLEAAIQSDALTQHHQFQQISSCRKTLRQINRELASFNEKLEILEAVDNF